MQIVKYEVNKGMLTVGFKEDNFVVYSQIAFYENKTREELLQEAYRQVKHAIEYEKTQDEHSFTTDQEGEEFIPEHPKIKTLQLSVNKSLIQFEKNQENATVELSIRAKDQYGDDIDVNATFNTSLGTIEGNILTIPSVAEYTEVVITAYVDVISDSKIIYVYPYNIEPAEPEPTEMDMIRDYLLDIDFRLVILELGL